MKPSHKTLLLWILLILMFVSLYSLFTDTSSKINEKTVPELKAEITNPETAATIEKVVVEPGANDTAKYLVTYKTGGKATVVQGPYTGGGNEISKSLDANNISWDIKVKEENSFWQSMLISWLPMILLLVILCFFSGSSRPVVEKR